MNIFPIDSALGQMRMLEVFEFHDVPVLFTCKNNSEQIYIAVALDVDQGGSEWLYSPITNNTAFMVRRGALSFRNAFLRALSGTLYHVIITNTGQSVSPVSAREVPDAWLPHADEILAAERVEDIVPYEADSMTSAEATRRGVFNFMLKFADSIHEAPARQVGRILTSMQELVDAIGYKLSGHHRNRGRIPGLIKSQTTLNVAFSYAGSFGVQLRSDWQVGNPEFTLVEASLKKLCKLFEQSISDEELKDELRKLEPRVVSKFTDFLKGIHSAGVGFRCQYGSMNVKMPIYSGASFDNVNRYLSLAREVESEFDIVEVHGQLRGLELQPNRFKMIDSKGNIYRGDIYEEALDSASVATINKMYHASILRERVHHAARDAATYRWHLLSLEESRSRIPRSILGMIESPELPD